MNHNAKKKPLKNKFFRAFHSRTAAVYLLAERGKICGAMKSDNLSAKCVSAVGEIGKLNHIADLYQLALIVVQAEFYILFS